LDSSRSFASSLIDFFAFTDTLQEVVQSFNSVLYYLG
jgi:hypothetical protein